MNSSTTTTPSSHRPTEEQIAARARELWLARGQPADADVAIWLEAERQLTAETRQPVTESAAVEPTAGGVAKARRGKSLNEKVDQALSDRPGLGRGGNAKILKQTT